MKTQSVNPFTGKVIKEYELWSDDQIEAGLARASTAYQVWRKTPLNQRLAKIAALAATLERNKQKYADMITDEMGKTLKESIAEIEKCAAACKFLSENLEDWFAT